MKTPCRQCGPGYNIGDEGCHHTEWENELLFTPEPPKSMMNMLRSAFWVGGSYALHGTEDSYDTKSYSPEEWDDAAEEAFQKWRREWAKTPIPNQFAEGSERTPNVSRSSAVECTCPPPLAGNGMHYGSCPVEKRILETYNRAERLRGRR